MISRGSGPPVILIPGIQDRWEWTRNTVRALARQHHVLTFSLSDADRRQPDPFDAWMVHLDQLADQAGTRQISVIGVSFGGLIAARYAATRPDRVRSLVLVSAPSPAWHLGDHMDRYLAHPWTVLPVWAVGALSRLGPEVIAAHSSWPARARFATGHVLQVLRAPASPTRIAGWVRAWRALSPTLTAECRTIRARTLLITGEPALDRVVPVSVSREYLDLIPGARHVTLTGTGHLGFVMHPDRFAKIVETFLSEDSCS